MVILLLGTIAFVVGTAVLAVQLRQGRLFTLLTFATCLFLLESIGAAVKAGLPRIFPDFSSGTLDNPIGFVPLALSIYIAAYLLFLMGYLCVALFRRPKAAGRETAAEDFFETFRKPSFQVLLGIVTIVTLAAGFAQPYAKIRAAGGLREFISTAYMYRFGTATEASGETAAVVLASLIAGTAVAFVALWVIAWARHELARYTKVFVTLMVLLLLVRQWMSMFRATFVFSILALIAAIESEHRFRARRIVGLAALVLVLLLAANFVHFYLYYLTGGWTQEGFLEAQAHLLAPHAHIYTLAAILSKLAEGTAPLRGSGLLESLFFFVPRFLWHSKLPSDAYGTMIVQAWSGMPTAFQFAVTNVGEAIAHFSYPGVLLMMLYGVLYSLLDRLPDGRPELRAAFFGMLLPRVLADIGMGVSAVAITLFSLALFLLEIYGIELLSRALPAWPSTRARRVSTVRGARLLHPTR
jgi:hypothetical protein